jgi:hypothetical protein
VTQKHLLSISLAAIVLLFPLSPGRAQAPADNSQASAGNSSQASQPSVDQDIDMLRKDLRSQKKQIIAANLQLTDKEAEKFWPLYDQYTAELVQINNAKYSSLKDYVTNYNTLTDQQALSLTQNVLGVDGSVALLRQKYMPMFQQVISGKKTALFFQLDRRLVMLIDIQLAAAVPMVQP